MSTVHETEPDRDGVLDRGVVIGEGITWLARWSWRLLLVAGATVIVWWLLAKLWVGVFPILLALVVATVLWPPTRWLRERGLPSAIAAALVILGSLAVFFGVLGAITPSMISQSGDQAHQASKGLTELQAGVSGPPLLHATHRVRMGW